MIDSEKVHGAIVHEHSNRKDSLIRVSLKAVILNDKGEVLVVKEADRDWWDIPGGGIDHGETIKSALARELLEEVGYEGEFVYETLLAEDPRYLRGLNLYQMRLTFLVKPESMTFAVGDDADEIQFIDAGVYEHSELWTERQIFMFSTLAKKRLGLAPSMLRDYYYDNGTPELHKVLSRFDFDFALVSDRVAVLDFQGISPDSFAWTLSINDQVYYMYAEDYVPDVEHIKGAFNDYVGSDKWNFITPKKALTFESSSPVLGASIYQKTEGSDELMKYAIDSGHDFVFLAKAV